MNSIRNPKAVITIIIAIVILVFVGTHATTSKESNLHNINGMSINNDFELLSKGSVFKGNDKYIFGTVNNISSRSQPYVQVAVVLYDVNNKQIGVVIATAQNFPGNSTWNFKAYFTNSNFKSYKVTDVLAAQ
jgi:hypothetical protein